MTSKNDLFDQTPEVFRTLESESDLGLVIVGVTLIEGLVSELIDNYSGLGEVGFIMSAGLGRKADVARAIGKLNDDDVGILRKLKKLRDAAAHPKTITVDLSEPGFAKPIDEIAESFGKTTLIVPEDSPRQKLILIVNRLAGRLDALIKFDERELPPGW